VSAFSARHFGTIASQYVSAYVYRTGNVDRHLGLRRDAEGSFIIGNAEAVIDHDSNVFVKGISYRGTRGLFELLTRKKVQQSFITDKDLQSYREILEVTHGHLENNDPADVIKTTRGVKFKDVISNYFARAVLIDAMHRVLRGNRGSIINFVKTKMIARPGLEAAIVETCRRELVRNQSLSLAIVIQREDIVTTLDNVILQTSAVTTWHRRGRCWEMFTTTLCNEAAFGTIEKLKRVAKKTGVE